MDKIIQDTTATQVGAISVGALAAYGTYKIAGNVWSCLSYFNRHCLRFEPDSYAKYGTKDSWALVTGGSDGVGLEICNQMAAQGFNICIVARNQQKIDEKL
jgi:NADPH:quinone reductase-like Zn-dependent oxidoreductase